MTSKVSFTVRRPTPDSRAASSGPDSDTSSLFKVPSLPRHIKSANGSASGSPLIRSLTSSPQPTFHDSDDGDENQDEEIQDELVTGFDNFGVQRLNDKKKIKHSTGPLIIPPLQNRDWREIAKKRKSAARFVPASPAAQTGADGSVGGLGTRDTFRGLPVQGGLQLMKKPTSEQEMDVDEGKIGHETPDGNLKTEPAQETEDQKAIRALLASANGQLAHSDEPLIDFIPDTPRTISEADAFQQDILGLPDVATLSDYARVPVSQFGAALLRGMGWKEGTAASLTGRGPVEPYLPEARPALLGIGAKARPVDVDGERGRRSEKKYVPVVKRVCEKELGKEKDEEGERGKNKERNGEKRDESGRSSRRLTPELRHGSTPGSRRTSRSPSRKDREQDWDRDKRERESGRLEREWERRRERESDTDNLEREPDRRRYDSGYTVDKERGRRRSNR